MLPDTFIAFVQDIFNKQTEANNTILRDNGSLIKSHGPLSFKENASNHITFEFGDFSRKYHNITAKNKELANEGKTFYGTIHFGFPKRIFNALFLEKLGFVLINPNQRIRSGTLSHTGLPYYIEKNRFFRTLEEEASLSRSLRDLLKKQLHFDYSSNEKKRLLQIIDVLKKVSKSNPTAIIEHIWEKKNIEHADGFLIDLHLPPKDSAFDDDIREALSCAGKSTIEAKVLFMMQKQAPSFYISETEFHKSTTGGLTGIAVQFTNSGNIFVFPNTFWSQPSHPEFFTKATKIANNFFHNKTGDVWDMF
jgi:hypothetical protein